MIFLACSSGLNLKVRSKLGIGKDTKPSGEPQPVALFLGCPQKRSDEHNNVRSKKINTETRADVVVEGHASRQQAAQSGAKRTRPLLAGLDLVRFTAAVMVMLFHLCTGFWEGGPTINPEPVAKILYGKVTYPELFFATWFGWIGVEIFFVISGLVIAYSAEGAAATEFVRSRVLRLIPAAFICATITAAVALPLKIETNSHLLRAWMNSITLYPFPPWVDPVYWTLGVELSFYAVIFLLLVFKRYHYLERAALGMGIVSSAYWILGNACQPKFLHDHLWSRKLELSLVSYGCFFAIGTLTYVMSREGRSPLRISAMALFIIASLVEVQYKTVKYNYNYIFHSYQSVMLPVALFLVALVLILVSMQSGVSGTNRAARCIRVFGLATYPLYLFHQIVGLAIMKELLQQGVPKYTALIIAIFFCLAGSIFMVKFLEPPIRALLRGVLSRTGDFSAWKRLQT